jgi:hypothetical protein
MSVARGARSARGDLEGAGRKEAGKTVEGGQQMSDNPEWFAPKRYGYGSGLPISWQGWALTLGYVALVLGFGISMSDRPLKLLAIVAPFTIAFIAICSRTTRGGWRWRWGKND